MPRAPRHSIQTWALKIVVRPPPTMLLVALLFCTVVSPSLQWPVGWGDPALGYDLTSDYLYDGYFGGPWNPDYLRWGGPYGYDYPHMDSHLLHGPDYYYGGPPRAVDFAKENYVRDYPYGGGTEVGMRDSVTVRKGGPPPYPGKFFGAPLPSYMPPRYPGRFASPYYPDDLFVDRVSPYYRRLYASGLASPRPSSLRTGGDLTFLRR